MANDNNQDDAPCWPVAAASRIRIKYGGDDKASSRYCRLFHNRRTGAIDLVRCNDDDDDDDPQPPRTVYDDSDADVEDEPSYKSYLATSEDDERTVEDSFHPSDVIGANLSLEYNANNPNTFHGMRSYAAAKFNVYSYPKGGKRCGGEGRSARHRHYALDSRSCEDFGDARLLIRSVQKLSGLCNVVGNVGNNGNDSNRNRPLKCLVILNPFSGGASLGSKTGSAHVYRTVVKPMLEEAGVEHDALVTRRGGHARERMAARNPGSEDDGEKKLGGDSAEDCDITTDSEFEDIKEYDAIVAMGGDGILFEIFQGIRARSDADRIMSTMKFGLVPCGTHNGLAKSVLHWSGRDFDRVESVFQICKGRASVLDVASYRVLSSENETTTAGTGTPEKSYSSFLSFAWGLIADCDFESEALRWLGPLRADVWAVYRGVFARRRYRARFSYLPPPGTGTERGEEADVIMPEAGRPLPDGWESFEEDFDVFWVCNTSHAASSMFTCPMAKMNDGLFHVLIVRASCSRLRLIQMLLKLDSGGHIDFEELEVIDCVAYQFEPLSKASYNVLDGELIEDGPVQARFIAGGAQFFAGEGVE